VVISRPGDEPVLIPANGFNLAGTVSKATAAGARHPAVVLVAGSGPLDRDETVAGIPIFGQLASALADAGFAVLRYDKRGIGQSGGRVESAGLTEYAEDVRAAVTFMGRRKDVDAKRISVVGHSEGGAAALIAGRRTATSRRSCWCVRLSRRRCGSRSEARARSVDAVDPTSRPAWAQRRIRRRDHRHRLGVSAAAAAPPGR
jgi:predicted alpha/beta hydrolase